MDANYDNSLFYSKKAFYCPFFGLRIKLNFKIPNIFISITLPFDKRETHF